MKNLSLFNEKSSSKLLKYNNEDDTKEMVFNVVHDGKDTLFDFNFLLTEKNNNILIPSIEFTNFPEFSNQKDAIEKYADWLIRAGVALRNENKDSKLTRIEL